jgi:hypothetical protein
VQFAIEREIKVCLMATQIFNAMLLVGRTLTVASSLSRAAKLVLCDNIVGSGHHVVILYKFGAFGGVSDNLWCIA